MNVEMPHILYNLEYVLQRHPCSIILDMIVANLSKGYETIKCFSVAIGRQLHLSTMALLYYTDSLTQELLIDTRFAQW
jgi:hypothetical protein